MPEMTGIEMCELLKGSGRGLPAILITGRTDARTRLQPAQADAAVLFKPFDQGRCLMRLAVRSPFPQEIRLAYKNDTRSTRLGPTGLGVGPAPIIMASRSGEENGGGAVATASPAQSTRKPELADFEELLFDLSSAFIRVSAEEVDSEIERWLQIIVFAMDVDRGTVAQLEPLEEALRVTHQWARDGVTAPDKDSDVRLRFPWTADRLLSGELVVASRMDEFPPEAIEELAYARLNGGPCTIAIPLKIGGTAVGAVSFGAVVLERVWTEKEIQRLKLVAEIFGNALERKRSEAEIRLLSEELRQASKVVTIGELTAALAHELNQPLSAIRSNSQAALELLAAKSPDLREVVLALEEIVRDNARAADTVRSVRALFQRGEPRTSSVDVKELLLDVKRIVSADAKAKNISLSMELSRFLLPVRGDKTHLTQALLNLVFNAFDSVCESDGPREVVLLASGNEPDQMRVSVRDSGNGIDPKVMPHLFEPFFTTKPTGMGMGLAIVKSIIEKHGGRLRAAQNPDRGATIEFELPVEAETPRIG
jgi:signal transduction histidine kinase